MNIGWNQTPVPEFIDPRFRENKPKRLVFSHWKRGVLACFRKNWVYNFRHCNLSIHFLLLFLWATATLSYFELHWKNIISKMCISAGITIFILNSSKQYLHSLHFGGLYNKFMPLVLIIEMYLMENCISCLCNNFNSKRTRPQLCNAWSRLWHILKVKFSQIGPAWGWHHWIGLDKDINRYRLLNFLFWSWIFEPLHTKIPLTSCFFRTRFV